MGPMKLRAPHLPADTVPNRFGWRHEGPGPQWPDGGGATDEDLLPAESFNHPALKQRPPYVPERQGRTTFAFMVRKGCAGLAHLHRREPEALYHRIMQQALEDEDGAAIRWMISGLQWDEDFVRLHTMGRLSIEELAYMVRWTYGAKQAPYRKWLNQWGREPHRPLPSAPGIVIGGAAVPGRDVQAPPSLG